MRFNKQYLCRLLVAFLAYVGAAWATRSVPFVTPDAVPIWFPTGVALFLCLTWGPGIWPAILTAAIAYEKDHSWALLVQDCLNTVEPVMAAYLILRVRAPFRLRKAQDLLILLGIGAVAMPVVCGTIWAGCWHLTIVDWFLWVAGDLNGVLLVTPFLLSLHRLDLPSTLPRRIEALCATIGLLVTVLLIFGIHTGGRFVTDGLALSFLIFPFMVWIGFRFGLFWASATLATTAAIAISQTGLRRGPFYHASLDQSIIWLNIFLATIGITSLVLAVIASDKARSEEERRVSEASVRNIFAHSPIGIFQSTIDGRFLNVNPAMARIFAYDSPEDMVSSVKDISSQLFGVAGQRLAIIETVLQARDYVQHEVVYQRKDSSVLIANLYMRAVRSTTGAVSYLEGFIEEITERKNSEERRLASERRFRELLECIRLLAVILDLNGELTFCNEHCVASTGWAEEELIGHSFLEFVPLESRAVTAQVLEDSVKGHVRRYLEVEILTKAGARRWVQWDTSPLRNEIGNMVGFACIGRDVTDHRELQQQFQQAQKMDAIGRLAGGVAHDINNVLQAVILPAELLLVSEKRPAAKAKLEGIVEVAQRGAAVAQQLLAFSRRQVVKPVSVDIHSAIAEMRKMLRQLIREDIEIVVSLNARDCNVRIDPGQFVQLVINLVVNAQDAIAAGGHITVCTSDVVEKREGLIQSVDVMPGKFLEISVADTGCGMSSEVRRRAFEPFFTTKEFGRGTGLGLSTVYGIVQQCGGSVEIASEVGMGTIVQIFLPICSPEANLLEDNSLQGHHRSGRVLLVEDEKQVRLAIEGMLKANGYEVEAADCAAAAEELFTEGIDLVVTDIVMPGRSGVELAKSLRSRFPELHVLLMSGYAESEVPMEFLTEGTRYLQKPFDSRALLSCLAKFEITRRDGRRPPVSD